MSRPCDAVECKAVVDTGRFMCSRHWRLVPQATQRTINARYRASPTRFALMHDVRYVEACAQAIEGIATAEGKPGENSYRNLVNVLRAKQEAAS
ncbi:hypothetical protein ACO2Q9_02690 [Variovorax sp. VNK109]|uniref:hypothetical protein n=1 Tax=Variovorax sp. VNK109 TaxID=3400919 RepID=UPI003C0F9AD3